MYSPVPHANRPNQIAPATLGYCNCYLYLKEHGKWFRWTLSRAFLNRVNSSILVVVDKFSKFAHFVPLKHPFTALSVAKSYMNNIYKLHGMPLSLISDRDRVFTSNPWKELFGLSGVTLRMSSAYHPQTDG
jgi:hypothetical protein